MLNEIFFCSCYVILFYNWYLFLILYTIFLHIYFLFLFTRFPLYSLLFFYISKCISLSHYLFIYFFLSLPFFPLSFSLFSPFTPLKVVSILISWFDHCCSHPIGSHWRWCQILRGESEVFNNCSCTRIGFTYPHPLYIWVKKSSEIQIAFSEL